MSKEDSGGCLTPQENAEVFFQHFSSMYEHEPTYIPSIVNSLDQLPIREEMDNISNDEKMQKAISQFNNSAARKSGICAEIFKVLATEIETFNIICSIVHNCWQTEEQPSKFDIGKLGIVPKNGDLSQPGNHRGIMMLEVGQKIISTIICMRLNSIVERIDHKSQCRY
eukprot:4416702-Ditylum_brightwellii.AAC.1